MSKLTLREKLDALQALRHAHKQALKFWLREHNKKGVKYTVRLRRDTMDSDGYTHFGEREYCKPLTIRFNGQINDLEDILPFLSVKKMNMIFMDAGFAAVDFKRLSQRYSADDRLMDYLNDSFNKANK